MGLLEFDTVGLSDPYSMPMRTPTLSGILAVAIAACGSKAVSAAATPNTGACITYSDTAAIHIDMIHRSTFHGDSVRLTALGIPYRPAEGITLVTDSATCQFFVDAANATTDGPADPRRIARAYVFRVGSSVHVLVGENQDMLRAVYVYYDESGNRLATLAAL